MKLFQSPQAIIAEIDAMEAAEHNRREDRATVSSFFNGEAPLSDDEAEELGLTINVNNLFGYSEINGAKKQLFSLYTKPTRLFTVEVDACPAPVRRKWEMEGAASMNDLIKDTGRLKPAYEGVSGDAGMHGVGVFTFPNATDWCPDQTSLSRLLVPDDAPADPRKLTHWAIETTLQLRDIHRFIRTKANGWKTGSLSKILARIYKDVGAASDLNFEGEYNPEELEYQRQTNSARPMRRRPSVRVYYFYQVRADKKGAPVDCTILLHASEATGNENSETKYQDRVVYEKEGAYCSVEDCIHPFFMDCIIGGTPMWHRVLGLGHLNYQLNHAVELLLNRAMQGTMEGMMNLWQATDAANRDEIQRVLMRHNGVVPENVKLIQQRFAPDLAGSLNMIQFYRQQGSRNARRGSGSKGDMLEIQEQWEQGLAMEESSGTMSNWYDYLDRLGKKMWERLTNPFIEASDAGYSEIRKFQSRLERLGIPLFWLQPHNVKIKAVRIVGDGNAQQEKQAASFLMQNRAAYGPKAQQEISRIATAAFTGSNELAERLVPEEETPDTTQVARAQSESNTCILQGKPPEVSDADIDEVHFPTHLDAMTGVVQHAAQFGNATFTPEQLVGFQALGAHLVMHIRKKESMVGAGQGDQNKAMARQWMQMLNEVASIGEQMAHNLQEKQQGQNAQPDPMEVAKIQLQVEQLRLSRDKFDFGREKWERQQNAKENSQAFTQLMAMEKNQREALLARNKAAANDVKSAATLAQLNQPNASEA